MRSELRKQGHFHDLETRSRDEIHKIKWSRLASLIAEAYKSSDEFKARMDRVGLKPGDIKSWDDWPAIPVLSKKELIGLQSRGPRLGGLLTKGLGKLKRVYMSPGPIFDPEDHGPDYWGWTEAFYAAGFREDDLVQMTFSYHLTPAGLMLEEPLFELGCAVVPAGPGNTQVQIELMTRLKTTGFVGMASYLKVIAEKARKAGLDLKKDFSLDVAFVAAERLPESLRNHLENAFDMMLRQGYGTADVGCIAYECPALGGMHISSRAHVEICDPADGTPLPPGETGQVVVTPFTGVYPLIRLGTGDLSYVVEEPCSCGRNQVKLGGIVGRVDDTAKVKGQFIYPQQAAEVMQMFPQIKAWQIVVSNPKGKDTLTVKLAVQNDLDQGRFIAKFQERLKLRPQVELLPAGESLPEGAPSLVDERKWD